MTAAVLRKENAARGPTPGCTRDDVLARYRRLREVGKKHHSAVLNFVSQAAVMQHARRLGFADGRNLVLDAPDDLNYVFDLAIHTAPPGRSRAIDRYARSVQLAPGSDEALVLNAMRRARFSLVSVVRRHEAAGLIVRDLLRDEEHWVVDTGWEASLPDGYRAATRFYTPDQFSVTAGVFVPLEPGMMDRVIDGAPPLARKARLEAIDDHRFAEAVYRVAIASGLTKHVVYQDVAAA